jgi:hypothetical protein
MRIIYCVGALTLLGGEVGAANALYRDPKATLGPVEESGLDGNSADGDGVVATSASTTFTASRMPGSKQTVQVVAPAVGTRSVEALDFDEVKKLLGFQDLDTSIIKKFLEQVKKMKDTKAKTMFPDPKIGDLLKYFNTGVLKELAVLYAKAESDAKSATGVKPAGGAQAVATEPAANANEAILTKETREAVLSAVTTFKTQLNYVLDELSAGKKLGRDQFDIKNDRVEILTRNIDYLIGALWFLQERPQFRSMTKVTTDNELARSMNIFEQMVKLVLEEGLPNNVGMQYTEFSGCSKQLAVVERSVTSLIGFSKKKQETIKADIHGLIPSLMAYEAIVEDLARRDTDGAAAKYQDFKRKVGDAKTAISNGCNDHHISTLETFAQAVMQKNPGTLMTHAAGSKFETLPTI